MSSLTVNFNFYLPAEGDGEDNGQIWASQVNANFAAIDALIAARMVNPMTGPGDMIRGGAGGAPVRIPPPNEGDILFFSPEGYPHWRTIDLSGWDS